MKKVSNFEREEHEHYVEPNWVPRRLFEVEAFDGAIWDPCCGFGTIPVEARRTGYNDVFASDLIDRGYEDVDSVINFMDCGDSVVSNIVCNPPYGHLEEFALHALGLATDKVAMVVPLARLNAAWRWLAQTPLKTVWLLSPRPSMPPGHIVKFGTNRDGTPAKVGGGKAEFCWLVWEHGHVGAPMLRWLHRDGLAP